MAGGIGGRGGKGEGFRVPRLLIYIKPGSEDNIQGLEMKTRNFCKQHCLGKDIYDLLQNQGFETPGALLHVSDTTLRRAGFRVGHIAELTRALRKIVGKEVQETQVSTTHLYGTPAILHCPAITLNLTFLRRIRWAGWSGWSERRSGWAW
jgi:hypothetical protein